MLTEKTTENAWWVTEVTPLGHRRVNKTVSTAIQNKLIAILSVHPTYQQRCSQQTTCQLRLCTVLLQTKHPVGGTIALPPQLSST